MNRSQSPAVRLSRRSVSSAERLRNIEDLTLAMADEEPYGLDTALWVLRIYLERHVSLAELSAVLGRLSNLGFIIWRVRSRRGIQVRRRATMAEQYSGAAWFRATPRGVAHLAMPRDVA